MRIIYDILFFIFSLFYLPFFLIKGKHKEGFLSRFGVVPEEIKKKLLTKNVVWIHAVSVGEMTEALRLADILRPGVKNVCFVLTTTTTTGMEIAKKFKKIEEVVLYFPVDFRASINSFLRGICPKAVIILETELWPNLLAALAERKIPAFIMNGRISDRAFPKYKCLKFLLKPLLNRLTWVGAQDDLMKSRFLELGLEPARIAVTGNIKYDWEPSRRGAEAVEWVEKKIKIPGSFLLIAGSTHSGEEIIFFDLFKRLKKDFPFFKLLVAPRHLNRLESIDAEAKKIGVRLHKVSLRDLPSAEESVFLLDQMGILSQMYRIADCVFVGGSLVSCGGHNLIEPAYFEKPILFGGSMENFKEMASEFKKAGAAIELKDARGLEVEIRKLIVNEKSRKSMGLAAKSLVERHRGAAKKNGEVFLNYVHL